MSSCPEILRRDPKAFADRTVTLTDIMREREFGYDSYVDIMRELQPVSPYSSSNWLVESSFHSSAATISLTPVSSDPTYYDDDGLLDWLGAPTTPVSIRFHTEFTEGEESGEREEEDTGSSHNVRRMTRRRTLLTRGVVDLWGDIEE